MQLDFLFREELGGGPILHARDKATRYSETTLLPSRDLDVAAAAFVKIWIDSHGSPKIVSADREFVKSPFKTFSGATGYPYRRGLLVATTRLELLSQEIIVFASSSNAC